MVFSFLNFVDRQHHSGLIECISLKEGGSHKLGFLFFDDALKFTDSLLATNSVFVTCEIAFKNVLGMTFRETFAFAVGLEN